MPCPEHLYMSEGLVRRQTILGGTRISQRRRSTVYRAKGRNTAEAVVVLAWRRLRRAGEIDLEGTEVCDWLTQRASRAFF